MALSSSIGNGLDYTNRILSSRLSESSHYENPLLNYLLSLNHQGEVTKTITVSNVKICTNEKNCESLFIMFFLITFCRIL